MTKKEIVLAALAPAKTSEHSPVQVQKLLFLIDANLASTLGGPFFSFKPYHYGPFDKGVYEALEELASEGLVEICLDRHWKSYRLTEAGERKALEIFENLPANARDYISKVSAFVRHTTFSQLVSSIYKAYPEMRKNSVFQD